MRCIVTTARCVYAACSRQFQQERVGGDIMDPDVRCARDCEAGIARQQHFSLAALARDAINGKRPETPCNGTALNLQPSIADLSRRNMTGRRHQAGIAFAIACNLVKRPPYG